VLARNVASIKRPPKVEEEEVEILTSDQVRLVTEKLAGHLLYEIAVVDLATGMRRGELLALRLSEVDLDGVTVCIERSLEETRSGSGSNNPRPNTASVLSRLDATQCRCSAARAPAQAARGS
jgi:integrase